MIGFMCWYRRLICLLARLHIRIVWRSCCKIQLLWGWRTLFGIPENAKKFVIPSWVEVSIDVSSHRVTFDNGSHRSITEEFIHCVIFFHKTFILNMKHFVGQEIIKVVTRDPNKTMCWEPMTSMWDCQDPRTEHVVEFLRRIWPTWRRLRRRSTKR